MRYIPHTESDIKAMLSKIGVGDIDALFESVPEALKLEAPLNIPESLSESELITVMRRLQRQNLDPDDYAQFIGAGAYQHYTPSIINHLIGRSEFSTSYTPYQPEVSQGTLQAVFEFQTMICMLTGMDISNASMYDGASSMAEAVLMAHRINRREKVFISRAVHPEYRQVVHTYLPGDNIQIIEAPFTEDGKTDINFLTDEIDEQTAAVVLQTPNFFGTIEQYAGLKEILNQKNILLIVVVVEPVSLGIIKPPGDRGADIVVGEAQSLGLPVSFGGPYAGFFSTRDRFVRQMPGRLAGETADTSGKRAYTLTLSTREQHIRREKATSNICTNQGLCALAVTIFLSVMGKNGMRELAEMNLKKANYLKNRVGKATRYRIRFSSDTFNEFVLECPQSAITVRDRLLEENFLAGYPLGQHYPELEKGLLLCATEVNTAEEMDNLAVTLEKIG